MKANRNLVVLMRSLPPSSMQKFSAIERASLALQEAGVDLSQLAMILRRLDRTRMLFRSLQLVLQRETSAAFSQILQVKERRIRAFGNAGHRLKAKLLLNCAESLRVGESTQKYFFKWFVQSNPQIIRRLASQILMKQKLSHKVVCWRLAFLVRVHKEADKRVDLMKVLQGIASVERFLETRRLLLRKEALFRMSPRYHNRGYTVMRDILEGFQRRRELSLRAVVRRLGGLTGKVKRMFQIWGDKKRVKLGEALRAMRRRRREVLDKAEAVRQALRTRRRDEIVGNRLQQRLRNEKQTVLARLMGQLRRGRRLERRLGEAASRLGQALGASQVKQKKWAFDRLVQQSSFILKKEGILRKLMQQVNRQLGLSMLKLKARSHKAAQQSKIKASSSARLMSALRLGAKDKRWRVLWKLRMFSASQGKASMMRTLKRKKALAEVARNSKAAIRHFLERLKDNRLKRQGEEERRMSAQRAVSLLIQRKLGRALSRLRDWNQGEIEGDLRAQGEGRRLARWIALKSGLLKQSCFRKLVEWRSLTDKRAGAGVRLGDQLRRVRNYQMKEALECLRRWYRKERWAAKLGELEETVRGTESSLIRKGLFRSLAGKLGEKKFQALEKLRDYRRLSLESERQRAGKVKGPLGWMVERLVGKRTHAFYKFLRCFGDGDPDFQGRREGARSGGAGQGRLKEEARKAFIMKVDGLLRKRPINNCVVEAVERYVKRKNKGTDMEGVLAVLRGRDQQGSQSEDGEGRLVGVCGLVKGLKERAGEGDSQSRQMLERLNNRERMRLLDLGLFMKDRDHTGRFTKLVEFLETNADLSLYEVAGIVKRNFKTRPALWELMEEVDEVSERQKLLNYLRRQNFDGKYDEVLQEAEAGLRFSEILGRLEEGNRGGQFDQALEYVNSRDRRVRDKLVETMAELDCKVGGLFGETLSQAEKSPGMGVARIYELAQRALERERRREAGEEGLNLRVVHVTSARLRRVVNETEADELERGLGYLGYANKVLKARFNDLVGYANKAQEEDRLGTEDLFSWMETQWGLDVDKLALAEEGESTDYLDRKDLMRAIEGGHQRTRWDLYLKERPDWQSAQELHRELGRSWKFTDFLKKVIDRTRSLESHHTGARPSIGRGRPQLNEEDKKEDLEKWRQVRELLNWEGHRAELEEYLVDSNEGGRNHEILGKIQRAGPGEFSFLEIVEMVLKMSVKGRAKHVVDFINRKTGLDVGREVLTRIRVKGELELAKEIEGLVGRLSGRAGLMKAIRQAVKAKERELGKLPREAGTEPEARQRDKLTRQIHTLEKVIEGLEGRGREPGLMDRIENHMRIHGKEGRFEDLRRRLAEKARLREAEAGKQAGSEIPELEDLIEVLNQNPDLRDRFRDVDRLVLEKDRSPRFQKMMCFLRDSNRNGRYFPLLRELDYRRVVGRRLREIRSGRGLRRVVRPPTLVDMARLLRAKARAEPRRFQRALDFFDQIEERSTCQKVGDFMLWREDAADFEAVIGKLKRQPRLALRNAMEEIQTGDSEGRLEGVWHRLNEETLGNEQLLRFMRKAKGGEDRYARVISFIESNGEETEGQVKERRARKRAVGLVDILDEVQREEDKEPGKMTQLLRFIDKGGVDLEDIHLDTSDPMFAFLGKARASGSHSEIFHKLGSGSGLLKDPERLLDHLQRRSIDGQSEDLVRHLKAFCKRHREYPDYGQWNQRHPLFKAVAQHLMLPFFRKLRQFAELKRGAEKTMATLMRKNLGNSRLAVLARLRAWAAKRRVAWLQELALKRRKEESLRNWMVRMSDRVLRGALLRLRGHRTAQMYRGAVTKGYQQKFWGLLLRTINPGVYKALAALRSFKDRAAVQEASRMRTMRAAAGRLKTGLGRKAAVALRRLAEFSKERGSLESVRKKLYQSIQSNWRTRTAEALWKLKENLHECEREDDEMEDNVKMVLVRAGHRVRLRQLKALKDLQIKGVQKRLINLFLLGRVLENESRKRAERKRWALNELRDFGQEEEISERKLQTWSRLGKGLEKLAQMKALDRLRESVRADNIKMSLNSLFKWKAANTLAKSETLREVESLMSLYKGALIARLEKSRHALLRDALGRLRVFMAQNKGHVGGVMRRLIHATSLKQARAFHTLRDLNRAFNSENSVADKMMARFLRSLEERRLAAFNRLRVFAAVARLRNRLSTTVIREYLFRGKTKSLSWGKAQLGLNAKMVGKQRGALAKVLKNSSLRKKRERFVKWRDLLRQELICRFNSKITSLCLSLRKNHRAEARAALERWSQKKQKLKYSRLALFLDSAKALQKRETYTHMKIHHMQKKLSSMCKVWSGLLDFIELRKKENIMYAFDAMSLENPWADRVPQLLSCAQVMSAQMCFWKLRLTCKHLLKKRRQRATNYKIDKVKLVCLEAIFSKKLSQYFMQIQIARRNKYL